MGNMRKGDIITHGEDDNKIVAIVNCIDSNGLICGTILSGVFNKHDLSNEFCKYGPGETFKSVPNKWKRSYEEKITKDPPRWTEGTLLYAEDDECFAIFCSKIDGNRFYGVVLGNQHSDVLDYSDWELLNGKVDDGEIVLNGEENHAELK